MAKERISTASKPDRWSYVWLAIATVLLVFSVGLWRIPLAAWLSPVFLIRFMRTRKVVRGYLLTMLALAIANALAWGGIFEVPLFIYPIITSIFALLYSLPYLVDRLLAPRLKGFVATLVFPLAATAFEFLITRSNPMGSFGVWANAQHDSLVLMQLVSITGLWGLTFLMSWFGSIVNWAWEHSFSWPEIRRGAGVYGAILALVVIFGSVRLSFFHPQAGTVRIHGLMEVDWPMDKVTTELLPLLETDRDAFHRITADLHALYIEGTIREARAGAQIVVWSEVAGFGDEEDTTALVARGQEVARGEGIYLAMALYTVFPDPDRPVDNRLIVIAPSGEIVLNHLKYGCTAFNLGEIVLPTMDTPYGKLSGVICCDLDFPGVVSQAGRQGVDILLVPSNEPLPSVVQMHTQQAPFRAVENGFSLFRPTAGGVSLATDPFGRVLAAMDHSVTSERVMVVQVPTHRVITVYSVALVV